MNGANSASLMALVRNLGAWQLITKGEASYSQICIERMNEFMGAQSVFVE